MIKNLVQKPGFQKSLYFPVRRFKDRNVLQDRVRSDKTCPVCALNKAVSLCQDAVISQSPGEVLCLRKVTPCLTVFLDSL